MCRPVLTGIGVVALACGLPRPAVAAVLPAGCGPLPGAALRRAGVEGELLPGAAGITVDPFRGVRADLRLGIRLRDGGRVADARSRLRAAVDTFGWLGARPWTQRAWRELCA